MSLTGAGDKAGGYTVNMQGACHEKRDDERTARQQEGGAWVVDKARRGRVYSYSSTRAWPAQHMAEAVPCRRYENDNLRDEMPSFFLAETLKYL